MRAFSADEILAGAGGWSRQWASEWFVDRSTGFRGPVVNQPCFCAKMVLTRLRAVRLADISSVASNSRRSSIGRQTHRTRKDDFWHMPAIGAAEHQQQTDSSAHIAVGAYCSTQSASMSTAQFSVHSPIWCVSRSRNLFLFALEIQLCGEWAVVNVPLCFQHKFRQCVPVPEPRWRGCGIFRCDKTQQFL